MLAARLLPLPSKFHPLPPLRASPDLAASPRDLDERGWSATVLSLRSLRILALEETRAQPLPFRYEETEAQPGKGICLRAHGQEGRRLRIEGDLQIHELLLRYDTKMS